MGEVIEFAVNNKFYELYEDQNGQLIDGHEIRPFVDWNQCMKDRPRWARVKDHQLMSYLDSELKPILGSEY